MSITRDAERIEIGNRFLSRTFRLRPCLAPCAVTNRLTGTRFDVQGAEFVLDLRPGQSLEAGQFSLEDIPAEPNAGRLAFRLRHAESRQRAPADWPPLGPWQGQLQVFVDAEYDLGPGHRLEIHHAALEEQARPALPLHGNAVAASRSEVVSAWKVTIEPSAQRAGGGSQIQFHGATPVGSRRPLLERMASDPTDLGKRR